MAVRRKLNIHTAVLSASLNYNDTSAFMISSPAPQKSPRLRSHLRIKILPHKQPENLNRSLFRPSKLVNSYDQTERSSSVKRYITSQGLSNLLSKKTNLPIVDRKSSRPFSALSSAGYMIKDFRKKNNGNIGSIQIKNKLIKNEFRVKVMQKVQRIALRDLNHEKGKFDDYGGNERGCETEKSKIINLIAVSNNDDIENHFDSHAFVESPDKQKFTLESESPSPSYAPRYEKF